MRIVTVLFSVIVSLAASYFVHDRKVREDKRSLYAEIEELFGADKSIMDGRYTKPNGYFLPGDQKEELYLINSGGVSIIQLTKEDGGFKKVETFPYAILYYVPKTRYQPAQYWEGMKISSGYHVETNRGEPNELLSGLYELATTDKAKGFKSTMRNGVYDELRDFPKGYNSMFYQTTREDVLAGELSFDNEDKFHIAISQTIQNYKIKRKDKAVLKSLTTSLILGGSVGLGLGVLLAMLLFRRVLIDKRLINFKWRNEIDKSIITFKVSFFGKVLVEKVKDNELQKGIAKVKGDEISINLPNSHYIYKIESIEEQKVTLIDLAKETPIILSKLN